MARIKWSAIGITNASGKSGGTIFSHNRTGSYIRRWAKPVNQQRQKQQLMRTQFGNVAQAWGQLTVSQVNDWENFAKNQTRPDGMGENHVMTGFTAFQSFNFNKIHAGFSGIMTAPPSLETIVPVLDSMQTSHIDLKVENATKYFAQLTFESALNSTDYVLSWAFAVVPAGRNRGYGTVKNQFTLRQRVAADNGVTQEMTSGDIIALAPGLSVGDKVYFRVHIHTSDGYKSNEITGMVEVIDSTP